MRPARHELSTPSTPTHQRALWHGVAEKTWRPRKKNAPRLFTASCQDDGLGSDTPEPIVTTVQGQVNGIDPQGCTVTTIAGEQPLTTASFEVPTNINANVQTFVVRDADDRAVLMARRPLKRGQQVVIDAQSTAVALVTQHPLFAPVKIADYDQVERWVTAAPHYADLLRQVELAIADGRDIYDESNDALLVAFSNVFDDLCEDLDPEHYTDSLDIIGSAASTRAIYDNPKVYPFHAEINGGTLTLRNTGLTPSYYGKVTTAAGAEEAIRVPSRADYGMLDMFRTVGEINLGPKVNYDFGAQGEYRFHLDRTSAAAQADFYLRLGNSILSAFGLDLGEQFQLGVSQAISQALANANTGVYDPEIEPLVWMGFVYNAVVQQLARGSFAGHEVGESLRYLGTFLSGSLNWYNKVKGIGNAALRVAYSLTAPTDVNFCLCYYGGQLSTCAEARLTKESGDAQSGYARQRLLMPLVVKVHTTGDDGSQMAATSYHRVKFEVVSGGGTVSAPLASADHENNASTYWTLGTGGEQKVKATVVDIITDKEISDPVYFTASNETADITIRLDWSRHSGRTDIDLHVVDPYGEEIYFNHMRSASGGYLDRDDVVGPGPEHIRWTTAPTGLYKIYVHYYPNNDPDKSVTSYKVSVSAGGANYQPVTGSIAYDQRVPVGQFYFNGSRATRAFGVQALESTADVPWKPYPAKAKK